MKEVMHAIGIGAIGIVLGLVFAWGVQKIPLDDEPDPLYLYRVTLLDGDTLEVVGDETKRGKGVRNHYVSIHRNGDEVALVNQPYWLSWERLPLPSDHIMIKATEGRDLVLTPGSGTVVLDDDADPGTLTLSTPEIEIVWEDPPAEMVMEITNGGELYLEVDGHMVSGGGIKRSIDRLIRMYTTPNIHRQLQIAGAEL